MIPQLTRAERGISTPYVSPKKAWDSSAPYPTAEVLVSVRPSTRHIRRQRHADAVSTGRKSRRGATEQNRVIKATQQTLIGWARVYLEGAGNDAMRSNVTQAVHRQAEIYSKAQGEPFTTSLKRVEEAMLSALVAAL